LMGLAWGRQVLRESFFPFILFAFCIPLGWSGQSITFPLRMLVVKIVGFICQNFLAIDIRVEGTAILDPTGRYFYEVAPACGGIRSLIATSVLAVIYAAVFFQAWWKRAIVIASAFPLAVLGNVTRMLAIVIAAEIWGQAGGKAVDEGGPQGIFALLPYIPAFVGLLLLGRLLHEDAPPPAAAAKSPKTELQPPAPGSVTPGPAG
jgi:exosortase